jgi:hypothetical protein
VLIRFSKSGLFAFRPRCGFVLGHPSVASRAPTEVGCLMDTFGGGEQSFQHLLKRKGMAADPGRTNPGGGTPPAEPNQNKGSGSTIDASGSQDQRRRQGGVRGMVSSKNVMKHQGRRSSREDVAA